MESKKTISPNEHITLLATLKNRFEENKHRHQNINWSDVAAKLEAFPEKMWSLNEMERTGGEPDVVDYDEKTKEYLFFDCSFETPKDRRSYCYDRKALDSRKEHKPKK